MFPGGVLRTEVDSGGAAPLPPATPVGKGIVCVQASPQFAATPSGSSAAGAVPPPSIAGAPAPLPAMASAGGPVQPSPLKGPPGTVAVVAQRPTVVADSKARPGVGKTDLNAFGDMHLAAWAAAPPDDVYFDMEKNNGLIRSITRYENNQRVAMSALREGTPQHAEELKVLKKLQVMTLNIRLARQENCPGDRRKVSREFLRQFKYITIFCTAEPIIPIAHPTKIMDAYFNCGFEVDWHGMW